MAVKLTEADVLEAYRLLRTWVTIKKVDVKEAEKVAKLLEALSGVPTRRPR